MKWGNEADSEIPKDSDVKGGGMFGTEEQAALDFPSVCQPLLAPSCFHVLSTKTGFFNLSWLVFLHWCQTSL